MVASTRGVGQQDYERIAKAFQTLVSDRVAENKADQKTIKEQLKTLSKAAPKSRKDTSAVRNKRARDESEKVRLSADLERLNLDLIHLDHVNGMAEDLKKYVDMADIVAEDMSGKPVGLLRTFPDADPMHAAGGNPGTAARILKIESITALPKTGGTGSRLVAHAVNLAHEKFGGRVFLMNLARSPFYASLGFGIVPEGEQPDRPDGLITPTEDNDFGEGRKMLFDTRHPGEWRQNDDGTWTHPRARPR